MSLKLDTIIAQRYKITGMLGEGAMAEVYKAEDLRMNNREVAVKLLKRAHCMDPLFSQRLIREGQAVAQIPHNHIVKVFDVGETDIQPFIVMELLHGKFLDTWMKTRTHFDWREVWLIGVQLASALREAHKEGIIHRDIKPANILWDDEKQEAKLADFGIAHLEQAHTQYTQAGQLIGTPQYMAPEQIQGRPANNKSDLFSLGVVLYHLLTGKKPFSGENLASLAYQINHAEQPSLAKLAPKTPKPLVDIINKLMAKSAAKRYQNAAELLRDLEQMDEQADHGGGINLNVVVPAAAVSGIILTAILVWFLWPASTITTSPVKQPTGNAATNTPLKQPGETGLSELKRSQIKDLISRKITLDCAYLSVEVTQAGEARINGHISRDEDIHTIWNVLDGIEELSERRLDIKTLPWPHCQAASLVAQYRQRNLDKHQGLKIATDHQGTAAGEPLVLDLTTPKYESYIYIDYFQSDGTVHHLYPGKGETGKLLPAARQMVFGQKKKLPRKSNSMQMVMVIASPNPLFKDVPVREKAQDYLKKIYPLMDPNNEKILADYITF